MQVPAPANKLHPLIATAAIAVTAVSVLGAVVLITNQVSAQHAAAPAAAVAAAAPESTDTAPARATSAVTPSSAPAPRPTATVSHRTRAAHSASPRVRAAGPQVAEASSPYGMPPPDAAAPPPTAMTPAVAPPVCADCGTVISVRAVSMPGEGTGIGAVAGGVLGGVIGNQFGHGSGKDATRILGAIGGAIAGHQIEKQARTTNRYDISVRMDDGSTRTLTRASDPGLSAGARVRVDGDELRAIDSAATTHGPTPTYTAAPGNG